MVAFVIIGVLSTRQDEEQMIEMHNRYEILEEIGQGGFAVVYRARDLALDRVVALKEMKTGLLFDPSEEEQFRLEDKTIARLDHPHIVTIYDIGHWVR